MLKHEEQLKPSGQLSPAMLDYVISILEIAGELTTREIVENNEQSD